MGYQLTLKVYKLIICVYKKGGFVKKILIVEHNEKYRKLLATELRKENYDVEEVDTPVRGLENVAIQKYDVVISDLHLPVMSGLVFTESVKNISQETVCIILTENHDENSELASIQNNIDLYFEKNKSLSILLSYIERLLSLRKIKQNQEMVLTSDAENIILSISEHTVKKDGKLINLTPKEYELLRIFLSNKNKVITRSEFVELAWEEPETEVDIRLVDSHIKKLRDKIKSVSIITVRGYGYRWNEPERH